MFNQRMPGTGNISKVGDFKCTVFESGWQAWKMDIVVIIGSDGIDKSAPTHAHIHTHTPTFSLSLELDSVWVPAQGTLGSKALS